jgi:predicted alpha/beta-hydrolase family hydrolase
MMQYAADSFTGPRDRLPRWRPRPALLATALAGGLLLVSCATVTTVPEGELPPQLSAAEAALAAPGVGAYTVAKGRIRGGYGRPVDYESYVPVPSKTGAMVFLAHGSARDLSAMRGWAAHWASYGVPVTVMSLRNSTWTNGHHDRNAADLRLLARSIHDGPVLYAGHSAGGLAAFLAAAADGGPAGRAVAYLGLDAVDSDDLALRAKPELRVPALFLLAEPSSCNARNNILAAVPDRPGVEIVHVRYATHCNFENPSDWACEALCGLVAPPVAAARTVARIRSLATAWVLRQTGATH